MDNRNLTREIGLLGDSSLERSERCPDDHALAAIAAGLLSTEKNEPLALHVSSCDYCLARIGELVRLHAEAIPKAVSELLLARAAKLGARPTSTTRGSRAGPGVWAAVAVLVLGVAVLLNRPWIDSSLPVPEARRIDHESMRPQIIWPAPGMSIDLQASAVRWRPVVGSLYYDVQVLSDTGDVLWRERVDESATALPDSLELTPGREYFLRVDAYLAEARSISSHHVVFSVQAPETGEFR